MSEVRIGDIAPINSVKNSDKIPISVGDSQAHTVEISTLKTFINQGTLTAVDWNNITNKPTFSAVATTGSYSDLTNQPSIVSPNELTAVENKIPTLTSQLKNDSSFVTSAEVIKMPKVIDFDDSTDLYIEDNKIYRGKGKLSKINIVGFGEDVLFGSKMYFTANIGCEIIMPEYFKKIGVFTNLKQDVEYFLRFDLDYVQILEVGGAK